MQLHAHIPLRECVRGTYLADGLLGFYNGLLSPLCSIPLVNAVVFGAYSQANWFLSYEQSLATGLLAGSYAGLVNTVVICPVELVKCKMQAQSKNATLGRNIRYTGSFDCLKTVLLEKGVQGIYTGGLITILREVPGYAAQFAAYEGAKL